MSGQEEKRKRKTVKVKEFIDKIKKEIGKQK